MTRVKSLPILQTAKVLCVLQFMLGAVCSCIGLILMVVVPTESPVVVLSALVALPVGAGILGFLGGALTSWSYNQIVQWVGGIQIDLEQETIASRPQSEDDYAEGGSAPQGDEVRRRAEESELRPISVHRLSPHPQGKDRYRQSSPTAELLGGEWVDIRNNGSGMVSLKGIGLYHAASSNANGKRDLQLVVHLPDCFLKPGEILRLHAGQSRELSVLRVADRTGANWHCFTGEDACVWNIREGDTATLYDLANKEVVDSGSYDPGPPEGVVLYRQADKFVPAGAMAGDRVR
jgi:hypothetical protein